MKLIKLYEDVNYGYKKGELFEFVKDDGNKTYFINYDGKEDFFNTVFRGNTYSVIDATPEDRLKYGILHLSYILGIDTKEVAEDIKEYEKDKLAEMFVTFKDMAVKNYERKLIELVTKD